MTFMEQLLISLENRPWDILYRAALGFVALAVFARLRGGSRSEWLLGAALLAGLLALRVVPAVVRRLLPFSEATRQVWSERRQLAKRYDSYQWRKLLGFGVGLVLYIVISQQFSSSRIVVSGACMVCGFIGTMKWRATAKQISSASVPRKK